MTPDSSGQDASSTARGPLAGGEDMFEARKAGARVSKIDRVVGRRLSKQGIRKAKPCSDAVFLRRVFLDVIGTLPTAEEARAFLDSTDQAKRIHLIDQLLEREEYAQYWGLKWGDLLRVKAEFPINLWPNAAQAYDRWIRDSLRSNKPYNEFVRELLASSGSNFRVPPVNFYRAMQSNSPRDIARMVALSFMGERADKWPEEQLDGMTVFFSCVGFKSTQEWKEEVVYFDLVKATEQSAAGEMSGATFPDGTPAYLDGTRDPRVVFADWLLEPGNPRLARCIANRAWYWLFGRGIVHEPDDFREDNPPSNPELLDVLEKEFVTGKGDLKALLRFILNSQTYQQSSIPQTDNPEAESLFAYYPMRQLDAEVLIDALCIITGTHEEYSSAIPEPFTFIPDEHRTIELPDGSITSSFLEMFGRPPRDTGMELERNNQTTAAQRLHMLNSSHVRQKIERSGKLRRMINGVRGRPNEAIVELYLTILSRYPTDVEMAVVSEYFKKMTGNKNRVGRDLVWALMNSSEFLYRH